MTLHSKMADIMTSYDVVYVTSLPTILVVGPHLVDPKLRAFFALLIILSVP